MKVIRSIIFGLFILSTLLYGNVAFSQNLIKYYKYNPIKWKKNIINVCLDDSAYRINNIENYLSIAVNTWSKSSCAPKLIITRENCDLTIFNQTEEDKFDIEPLATNLMRYDDKSNIYFAKIVINDYYQKFFGDATKEKFVYDVPSILAHELGHAFGLSEYYGSDEITMSIKTYKGTINKRKLSEKDLSSIDKLYCETQN